MPKRSVQIPRVSIVTHHGASIGLTYQTTIISSEKLKINLLTEAPFDTSKLVQPSTLGMTHTAKVN